MKRTVIGALKRALPLLMLSFWPHTASASNYATCLLDRMGRVENSTAAHAANRLCKSEHPGGMMTVKWGAGLGFFSKYNTPDECIYDKGRRVEDRSAANFIGMACRRLYSKEPPPACFTTNPPPWCEYRNLKPYSGPYDPLPTTRR